MCVKVDNTNQGSIYVFLSDVLAVVEFVAFTKEVSANWQARYWAAVTSCGHSLSAISQQIDRELQCCQAGCVTYSDGMLACCIHYLQAFVDMIANEGATVIGLPLHPEAL